MRHALLTVFTLPYRDPNPGSAPLHYSRHLQLRFSGANEEISSAAVVNQVLDEVEASVALGLFSVESCGWVNSAPPHPYMR